MAALKAVAMCVCVGETRRTSALRCVGVTLYLPIFVFVYFRTVKGPPPQQSAKSPVPWIEKMREKERQLRKTC